MRQQLEELSSLHAAAADSWAAERDALFNSHEQELAELRLQLRQAQAGQEDVTTLREALAKEQEARAADAQFHRKVGTL